MYCDYNSAISTAIIITSTNLYKKLFCKKNERFLMVGLHLRVCNLETKPSQIVNNWCIYVQPNDIQKKERETKNFESIETIRNRKT